MPSASRIRSQLRSEGRLFPVSIANFEYQTHSIKDSIPTETWAC
jgi:hypothetical protein